ncbi:MAG: DUF4190 domain-containing protein [Ilumatobacteraceae bacterium]
MSDTGTPGWYPDPFRRFEFRYYNGQRWTADVSMHGQRMVDSGEPAAGGPQTWPVAQQPWTSTSQQPWTPSDSRPHRRGLAIASFVLAVTGVVVGWVPFVFAVAAAGAVAAVIFGVIGLRHARQNNGAGRGFATAGLVIAPVALVVCFGGFLFTRSLIHALNRYDNPGRYTLVPHQPCSVDGNVVTFDGTITNDETDDRRYEVKVAYRIGGSVVATEVVKIDTVTPGTTRPWSTRQTVSGASKGVTCAVDRVKGPAPYGVNMG